MRGFTSRGVAATDLVVRGFLWCWRQWQQARFGGDDADRRAELTEIIVIAIAALALIAGTVALIAMVWK
jgi:hypothetical protein